MSAHNRCGLCRIDIKNLTVQSDGDTLIDQVNMDFQCGQLTALIGRNGAGKTTLLKAILGERAYQGEIVFQRHDDLAIKRPVTGYVPQQLLFDRSMPVSVLDFCAAAKSRRPVWLGQSKKTVTEIEAQLERVDCLHVKNRRLGDLSGGELQRVLLAMAIDPMPDLLILDEPVSGMDVSGLDLFYKSVLALREQYHMAILLVSHDLDLIRQYADMVVLLDKRVVARGTPEEVFASQAFADVFGSGLGGRFL